MQNNLKVFDFIKIRKIWLSVYAVIIVAAILMIAIFGVNLSNDFKGGTVLNYSFTGEIDQAKAETAIEEIIGQKATISENRNFSTDETSLVITLPSVETKVDAKIADQVLKVLTSNLKNNITEKANIDGKTLSYNFEGSIKETKTVQTELEEKLGLTGVIVSQDVESHTLTVVIPSKNESDVTKKLVETFAKNKLTMVSDGNDSDNTLLFSFEGEIAETDTVKADIEKNLDVAGVVINYDNTQKLLSIKIPNAIESSVTAKLTKLFPDNNVKNTGSNSVSGNIANNFFLKCLVAVLIAGALVVIYVGIRFRKIGGISAGMFALLALVLDCFVAFSASVFFRLEIDSNFMSVILTTFGYSLNDTIVVYDRIRENSKLYPDMELGERINTSITQSLGRTIKTTVATFLAIVAIVVVAEFFGLSTLRSFAIPMSFGILSGCITSVCISSPLWYSWKKFSNARKAKK